jgi:hypothetical protein
MNESNHKPVCTSSGRYKIRTSDGNTALEPSRIREIIIGLDSYQRALLKELEYNLDTLEFICRSVSAAPPSVSLNDLKVVTIDAILSNGTLSSFFEISLLIAIRSFSMQVNKLLDFAITAGGVVYPAAVFYKKIKEICPTLKENIKIAIKVLETALPSR